MFQIKKNNIIKYIIVLIKEDGDSLEQYFTNNPNLKSELRNIVYKYQGLTMSFFSDNGVFSKDKLVVLVQESSESEIGVQQL